CGECVEIVFGKLIVPFSKSPNKLAIAMKIAVWTFTLTKGPVKLGKAHWVIWQAVTSLSNYFAVRLITLSLPYYHVLFVVAFVTFDEKYEVTKSTRRLVKSLIICPLSASLTHSAP
ncbi:hypothetical protein H5410_060670, partial [Solanum commersonii]